MTLPNGILFEDEENKGIIYAGVASLAYTGLARLAGAPTVAWITDVLARAESLGGVLLQLKDAANVKFRSLRLPPHIRRTSFVLVGYGRFRGAPSYVPRGSDGRTPFLAIISNAEQSDGSWKTEASTEFSIQLSWLTDKFVLRSSGQALFDKERITLTRTLRKCLASSGEAEPLARLLARQIRSIAERNSAVGRSVMTTIVPRSLPDGRDWQMWARGFPLFGTIDESALFKVFRQRDRLPSRIRVISGHKL
ncbi:MAG TPA: hypothetical protein VEG60_14515 [Candidatus Binatia bacterium]|nr:hypothetical protein [Candidatus Binatia bacterium]